METFFPTSTPATIEDLTAEIDRLNSQLNTMINNWEFAKTRFTEAQTKIDNVAGHIRDLYSMNGEIDDEVKYIAELLDIPMTKTVNVTFTVEFSGTVEVPMDTDLDDLESEVDFDYNAHYSDYEWDLESNLINSEIEEQF